MNDEKMRILRMLENGKISADEAVRLLEALSKEKDGIGFVDRIVHAFSFEGTKIGKIREEFKADKVLINVNASSLTLKESSDSVFRVYGDGRFSLNEEGEKTKVGIFGSMTVDVPANSSLHINLKAGDLNGILDVPLKLESKMSNTELYVKEPLDIDANVRMGSLTLSFSHPVNMSFNIVNSLGSISQNLGLNESDEGVKGVVGKDEGLVKVDAKLSSIELKKKKESDEI